MKHVHSIEDIPLNSFHRLLALRSGGGSFVDGYILSIIGVVMMQMSTALTLSSFWEGMIAASALIGIFFGGFMGGWFTDFFGRRRVFFVGPIVFTVASIAQLWADSATTIFTLRLLIGVAVGIEYPVATALLVEFLPKKHRGQKLATLTVLWFAGAACAYVIGEIILRSGAPDAWQWVIASSAIFGTALFLLRLGTPESPRWLLTKGRRSEAEITIKKVFGESFSLTSLPEQDDTSKLPLSALLHSGYGKRLFFVLVFWTCSIIPIFAVYAFAPKVLLALKLTGDLSAIGSISITAFFMIGCLLASKAINVVDRRKILIYGFLFSGLALVGLGAFDSHGGIIILVFFSLFALFIGGAQALCFVYPNEIFPTEVRSVAVGIATSLSRVGAAAGTYLVPMSLAGIGVANTMFAAAAITFFGLLVSWWLAPETRSLSLQEAAALR